MSDKIRLIDIEIFAYHGTEPEERKMGQRFTIDVEVTVDLAKSASSDNLKDAVNYVKIWKIVDKTREERFNLIETLAEHIAYSILDQLKVDEVTVRVKKPHSPIGGILDRVEVELTRSRK